MAQKTFFFDSLGKRHTNPKFRSKQSKPVSQLFSIHRGVNKINSQPGALPKAKYRNGGNIVRYGIIYKSFEIGL